MKLNELDWLEFPLTILVVASPVLASMYFMGSSEAEKHKAEAVRAEMMTECLKKNKLTECKELLDKD